MDWNAWREVINFSTPLAGLMACGWMLYRGINWVAVEIVKPVFGHDGAFVKFLKSQAEEAEKHTAGMIGLQTAIQEAGMATAMKLDQLVLLASRDQKANVETGDRVLDLLQIQRHWVAAAKVLANNDTEACEHLSAIGKIVDKYC